MQVEVDVQGGPPRQAVPCAIRRSRARRRPQDLYWLYAGCVD